MNLKSRIELARLKLIEQKVQQERSQVLRNLKISGIDWRQLNLILQELAIIELQSLELQRELLK